MTEEYPSLHETHQAIPEQAVNEKQNMLLRLSGQQSTLYRALLEKDPLSATMYMGTLMILDNTGNPERFALAAHDVRELMEKLPDFMDVRIEAQKESLKVKVRDLEVSWRNTLENTECYSSQIWSGRIDRHLIKMLKNMHTFFEWFDKHHPRRKAEIAETLRGLDNSGRILPPPLEKLNVETWEKMRNFFQAVAHHKKFPDAQEFTQWLDSLERFLLDRLYPRTFEDIDAIDEIIREGEKNA